MKTQTSFSPTGLLLAFLLLQTTPPFAVGQAADTQETPQDRPPAQGQTVMMSQFEVTTTQGSGYVANNSARGFKTDQTLLDIPQVDLVVTSDLIKDTGYENSSDVLRYVGVASPFRGEAVAQRGTRDANPYLDDLPDTSQGFQDDILVDSYDVIKGPTEVLYQNAALSGVIIKNTKKPLPFQQTTISESITEWGQSRTEFDYNAPIGTIGDAKLTMRVLGAVQVGKQYWQNTSDHRVVVHPMIEIVYKNTTVRAAYDFEDIWTPNQNQSLMTPNGGLYTGWGRDFNGLVPGASVGLLSEHKAGRLEWLQKISSNWESRFEAMVSEYQYLGSLVRTTQSVDWTNRTEVLEAFRRDLPTDLWDMAEDVTGKYELGALAKGQSTFGFGLRDEVDESEAWTDPQFGPGGSPTLTVSIATPAAINATPLPPISAYPVPANPGTRTKTLFDDIYYQQELDLFQNHLALVGGITFATTETITDTNIAFNAPYSATDLPGTAWLHRFGAVIHVLKDVSLYALNSTVFTPATGVDYNNTRLPNVVGTGNEVGIKTAFLDGRVSSAFAFFHAVTSNSAIVGPGLNVLGSPYSIPIGSTTSQGVDGDLATVLAPGWQLIATGYVGTVKTQAGVEQISGDYDNSWSLYTRYDFQEGSIRGLSVGAGVNRIGSYWVSTSGIKNLAPGYILPGVIKLHEATPINAFANYRINKHWRVDVTVENLLNQAYVVSTQTITTCDPSPPLSVGLTIAYKF